MNWYSIITTIIWVIFGFLAVYFKNRIDLVEKAEEAVNMAEQEYNSVAKAGGQKMEFAIKWIHDSLPEPMKIFISEDMIRNIVQKAFEIGRAHV